MNCRLEYQNRLQARQQASERFRRRDDLAGNLRVAAFGLGLVVAWGVFGRSQLGPFWLLAPLCLFVVAVVYHEAIRRRQRAARRAVAYYKRCLDRLDGKWADAGATGVEFLRPEHAFSGDLDIFGKGSLFQWIGAPVTHRGAGVLAEWLAPDRHVEMPTSVTVVGRQDAVRSLRDQLDLREHLAGIDPSSQSYDDANAFQQWLVDAGELTANWVQITASILGSLGVAALAVWYWTASPGWLILVVLLELAFVRSLRRPFRSIKRHSERAVMELRRIAQAAAAFEEVDGSDSELRRLRGELMGDEQRASKTIGRLERLVSQYENLRRNAFVAPLAFVAMANVHLACAIDRWRARHGRQIERWFQAVGEMESLLAFAQLHFEHPDYCFPQFVDSAPQFVAKQLAHPLLVPGSAAANDVELSQKCCLLLVSGSNMSGKSTLLRSVGVNAILAWAGAPVFAQSLTLSRLQVASAMRMQDSLQSGTSHFMAELHRIRLVVELSQRKTPKAPAVLFLLDEILHGTNSHDRLVGARGVIKSLLESGAIGLVTTHDLALSDLVTDLGIAGRNVHFCDSWRDGKMTFDYQMREGVVPKTNALSLMRLLGLEV